MVIDRGKTRLVLTTLAGLSGAMNGGVRVDFRIRYENLCWKQGAQMRFAPLQEHERRCILLNIAFEEHPMSRRTYSNGFSKRVRLFYAGTCRM